MDKNKKREDKEKQIEISVFETGEDATKYGEFISSFFTWITPKEQKNRAEELENMTNNKNDK